jgi:hypothetical protein
MFGLAVNIFSNLLIATSAIPWICRYSMCRCLEVDVILCLPLWVIGNVMLAVHSLLHPFSHNVHCTIAPLYKSMLGH